MGTKERIVEAALDLFSTRGYDSVTMEEIAGAVGIKAPSLYKHYKSKRDIWDSMIETQREVYYQKSVLDGMNFNNARIEELTPEMIDMIVDVFKKQVYTLMTEPTLIKCRRLFTIEQFRSDEAAKELSMRSFDSLKAFHTELAKRFIEAGLMKECDPELFAVQFLSPISVMIGIIDREPYRREEMMDLLDRHVRSFILAHKA